MERGAFERSAATVDGALLADARLVRRVIKRHKKVRGMGLEVPHGRCYVVPRDALAAIAGAEELGCTIDKLPDRVMLLARPSATELVRTDDREALRNLWRAAFHARVHLEIERKLASGALTEAGVRERIHRLGETEFDEIRYVLKQDHHLLGAHEDVETYAEFAALWLELRAFSPDLPARMFPTLDDPAAVLAIVKQDLDPDRVLAATRPAGAEALPPESAADQASAPPSSGPESSVRRSSFEELVASADEAAARGNVVRSSLLRMTARELAEGPASEALAARDGHEGLDRLALDLKEAVGDEGDDFVPAWTATIATLAKHAATGARLFSSPEARVLYDLQKACLASTHVERTIDVLAWIGTLGRTPVVRPLPRTRRLHVVFALRAARKKVLSLGLHHDEREALERLLARTIDRAEKRVREELSPIFERALDAVGLVPKQVPERVAREKLVDELVDQALEAGFVGIGHARDAISRNQIKMKDLSLGALVRGDELLRLDRALGRELDGVYKRGEIYLRALQKISSVAFGTGVGRAFSLWVALPIGGAFVVLEGLTHLLALVLHLLHVEEIHFLNRFSFAATALLLLGLLHSEVVRRTASAVARALGTLLAWIFWRGPRFVLALPIVRDALESRPARALWHFGVKPGAIAAVATQATPLRDATPAIRWGSTASLLVALALVLNSRAGVLASELVTDAASRAWRRLRRRILPGVFRFVSDLFRRLGNLLERGLYTVDEWLRFREGENPAVVAIKGAVGVVWFFVAYVVRFYVNLLVEPQLNPIKHFPVVTVSHKIILPFFKTLHRAIENALMPVSPLLARAVSGPTVLLLPGFFGFLVWELKENFRLYAATRAPALEPAHIGHHGETMIALMRPGFHSGTLPKLFAKLRRAARKDEASVEKHREAIDEVGEKVRHFVEREVVALLHESALERASEVSVRDVKLASNRVRVSIARGDDAPAVVQFEDQSGFLVASVFAPGFFSSLGERDRVLVENALAGLYARAGVDVVREQLAHELGEGTPYDIADEGLVVWPDGSYRAEIVYPLFGSAREIAPRARGEGKAIAPRPLVAARALFGRTKVTWSAWVDAWTRAKEDEVPRVLTGASILPRVAGEDAPDT